MLETTIREICEKEHLKTEHILNLKKDHKTLLEEALKNENCHKQ